MAISLALLMIFALYIPQLLHKALAHKIYGTIIVMVSFLVITIFTSFVWKAYLGPGSNSTIPSTEGEKDSTVLVNNINQPNKMPVNDEIETVVDNVGTILKGVDLVKQLIYDSVGDEWCTKAGPYTTK